MPDDRTDTSEPMPLGRAGLVYLVPIYDHAVLADRKATFILTFSGLLLTVLAFFAPRIAAAVNAGDLLGAVVASAVALDVGLIVAAAVIAYVAYVRPIPPPPTGTLPFFREIAGHSAAQYANAMASLSAPDAAHHMLHYNYSAAVLAAGKFRLINRSLCWLRPGLIVWMALLLALGLAV